MLTSSDQQTRFAAVRALGAAMRDVVFHRDSSTTSIIAEFWESCAEDMPIVRKTVYEVLAADFKGDDIPLTIWKMPDNDQKKMEILAWAAEHHVSPNVRHESLYILTIADDEGSLRDSALESRSHDPDLLVRFSYEQERRCEFHNTDLSSEFDNRYIF